MEQGTGELNFYRPEKVITPEAGEQGEKGTVLGIDPESGKIVFRGNEREAQEWLKSEEGERYKTVSSEEGGVAMPGLVDSHNHPIIWTIFDDATDLSEVEKISDLRDCIAQETKNKPDSPLIFTNFRTEKIKELRKADLDGISTKQPIIVSDPSFHGGVLNTVALQELQNIVRKEKLGKMAGSLDIDTGKVTEEYIILAYEMFAPSSEVMQERGEKNLETWLAKGITTVHDMEMSSVAQFISFLKTKARWEEKKPQVGFPVEKFYVSPYVLQQLLQDGRAMFKDLEKAGLWKDEMFKDFGMKLLVDGSFGSHTARLSSPYLDKDTLGEWAIDLDRMNKAIELALSQGLENIAFHAIGDEAIKKVLETAARWEREAKNITGSKLDTSRWRIEHFELPPHSVYNQMADMGIWASMQPNFVSDGVDYVERLGDRTRMICPHRKVLGHKIPLLFGSDGMPTSALYGIWAATHAVEENQRLNFIEALAAYSITAHRFGGREQGNLHAGERADIIIFDPEDLKLLGESAPTNPTEFKEMMLRAQRVLIDRKPQRVIRRGNVVKSQN